MKYILIILIFISTASSAIILISQKNIKYKELINKSSLGYVDTGKNTRCKAFDINLLDKNKYQAKRFIFMGREICQKDLQIVAENKIQYDFGNILIQRDGKVLGENKDFVKIKKYDGSIIKIYKNGQK